MQKQDTHSKSLEHRETQHKASFNAGMKPASIELAFSKNNKTQLTTNQGIPTMKPIISDSLLKLAALSCNFREAQNRIEELRTNIEGIKPDSDSDRQRMLRVKKLIVSCSEELVILNSYVSEAEKEAKKAGMNKKSKKL